ncbi:MAG: HD domain-containing protein [Chloroflexi bacterium]|nr:MAG: HD domain-containing protein [Chloroflexota bacterium]
MLSSGARSRCSTTRSGSGRPTTSACSRPWATRVWSPCATPSSTRRTSAASGSCATSKRPCRPPPRRWISNRCCSKSWLVRPKLHRRRSDASPWTTRRRVMQSGEPVMEARVQESKAESPLNPRAVLCVPITLRGTPLGVLFLANYQVGHAFTADHRNLVTELATQAAVAIDNARLFKDREDVIFQSLVALANTSDARDRYTAGHSQRVTQYALMIARQMRYSPNDQSAWVRLERGCRLHDIGKIGVPDEILRKTGKLTEAEFEKMKEHTTVGFNILSALKMLTDELVIVRSHHERYDGKGYPDRKKGDELPIFAWIVSAADAIDAMTSDRPYRKGMSLEVAIEQVREGAGTHFHPDVVEAVLDAAHSGTLTLIPQESLHPDAPTIGAFENPVA